MNDGPTYSSLRDYVRVLRDRRATIFVTALAVAGMALLYSVRQDEVYNAEASLTFNQLAEDSGVAGLGQLGGEPPIQASARAAELATRRAVFVGARERLGLENVSVEALQDAVTARPEAQTNFVIIESESGVPLFAAQLANAVAREAAELRSEEERERLDRTIRELRRALRDLEDEDVAAPAAITFAQERIGRLQALRDIVEPVEIGKLAAVPKTPTSPKPVRNTVLGVIFGLILGILLAFVRDSLDRRLRTSREIEEELGLPVLSRVREEALGNALGLEGGVVTAQHLETFRILRTNLDYLDTERPVKTVVVTSALPEEGKSSVAAALAAAYASAGKLALLVECDLRRPVLARRLGLNASPGLAEYLMGEASPGDILQTVEFAPGFSGTPSSNGDGHEISARPSLVCITAGRTSANPAELVGSDRFRKFLADVGGAYDAVVLDTSPMLPVVDTMQVIPHADAFLLCVRASRATREQARATKEAIGHLPERPAGLIITGVRSRDEEHYGSYSYAYDYATR